MKFPDYNGRSQQAAGMNGRHYNDVIAKCLRYPLIILRRGQRFFLIIGRRNQRFEARDQLCKLPVRLLR